MVNAAKPIAGLDGFRFRSTHLTNYEPDFSLGDHASAVAWSPEQVLQSDGSMVNMVAKNALMEARSRPSGCVARLTRVRPPPISPQPPGPLVGAFAIAA